MRLQFIEIAEIATHLSFSVIYITLLHPQSLRPAPSILLPPPPPTLPIPERNQALAKKLSHQMSTINNFIFISISHPKSNAAFDRPND